MKVCLAQISSEKGNISKNIEKHLRYVQRAAELNADLIVFPELSITGYEPTIAENLATDIIDERFNSFQELADDHEIAIGIGMPMRAADGINISMLIFQAQRPRMIYSKRILHEDEHPYFVSGSNQPSLTIRGIKVALGICYETLQREHFVKATEEGADLCIASVSKPDRGTDKAYVHFPSIAEEFQTPILMVNSVGFCDNFLSNGRSSIWNKEGKSIGELDSTKEGLLIYDSSTKTVQNHFLNSKHDMTSINYNGKTFRPISNSDNGETSKETVFHYKQEGDILTSEYAGGQIRKGHLIGLVDENGKIEMRYHQVNENGELMTGKCISTPQILPNGKIRLHEKWQWTSGDQSEGESILEEQ